MILESFGKLFNSAGELLAEGQCEVDTERGSVTLRPLIDAPLLSRQRGASRLRLENGSEFSLDEQVIRIRLNVPGAPSGPAYRLLVAGGPESRRLAGAEQ